MLEVQWVVMLAEASIPGRASEMFSLRGAVNAGVCQHDEERYAVAGTDASASPATVESTTASGTSATGISAGVSGTRTPTSPSASTIVVGSGSAPTGAGAA